MSTTLLKGGGWCVLVSALLLGSAAAPVHAHVHWHQVNGVTPETAALYHFNDVLTSQAAAADGLPSGLGLTSQSGSAALDFTGDTPGTIFAPGALQLASTQTLRSTDSLSNMAGDLTIEYWFKWTPTMTSATMEIGLQSGAKIFVARDLSDPANDKFGVSATHGAFMSAPGFINWVDVGEEEASLNEWRHLALAIHSAGIHYDAVSAHDVYSTGTRGRIYLNGHETGLGSAMDLTGLKVHDASLVTLQMRGGGMVVDEFAVWRRDWSVDGTVANPFANGRGNSSVGKWQRYD